MPLADAGAILEISDGSVASSTLKPTKKMNNAAAMLHSDAPISAINASATTSMAIASRNTGFILRRASAMMTSGTISTKEAAITGR